MTLDDLAGVAHEPDGTPKGTVILTHGAGGNRDSPMLVRICDEWARHGYLAVRYNLPYRRRRPKGPPSKAVTEERGISPSSILLPTDSFSSCVRSSKATLACP